MKLSTVCFLFVLVCGLTITIYFSVKIGLDMKEKKYKRRCQEIVEKLRDKKEIVDNVFVNFPKYYINLDRSVERREKMEEEFRKYGIKNIERVSACDGKKIDDLNKGDFGDVQFINQIGGKKKLEVAITCSHLKTIKKAWDRNLDSVLIIEDDVTFCLVPHWKINFETILKSIPEDADVILLTHVRRESDKLLFNKRDIQSGAVCYLITKRGMEKVVKNFFRDGKIFLGKKSGLKNPVIDTGVWDYLNTYYVYPRMFPLDSLLFDSTHSKTIYNSIFSENHKILEHYYDENQKE